MHRQIGRAELCRLRLEDVRKVPKGKYALLLRFSTTDQYSEGKWIPISEMLYQLIERWKKRIGEEEGYMLRGGWSTKSTTLRYLSAWSGASIDVYEENKQAWIAMSGNCTAPAAQKGGDRF